MKKTREIKPVSKESMLGVIGLMIALIAVIAILSPLPQGTQGIARISVSIFGSFGFWAFFIALFSFGVYLMFSRKLFKIRFDISLVGMVVFVFAFLALTSNLIVSEAEHLRVDNFIALFQKRMPDTSAGVIFSVETGGGYIGFFLAALFNYLSRIGAIIITSLILLFGVGLIFNRQVKVVYIRLKEKRKKHKEQAYYYKEIRKEKPDKFEDIVFQENKKATAPIPSVNEKPVIASPKQPDIIVAPKPSVISKVEPSRDDGARAQVYPDVTPVTKPAPDAQAIPPYRPGNGDLDFQVKSFSGNQGLRKAVFFMDGDQAPQARPEQQTYVRATLPNMPTPAISEPVISNPDVNEDLPASQVIEAMEVKKEKPVVQQPRREEVKVVEPTIREYILPPLDLLDNHESKEDLMKNEDSTSSRTELINTIFEDLNIGAKVVGHTIGPSVTRYDVQMDRNVSVSSMSKYINDISIRLGGVSTRFEPLVIGKATSGLEIPNEYRTNVGLKEALEKMETGGRYNRDIPFGKNISGDLIYANITDLPHMLIAGSTGSGKSIFVHSILMALIMRNRPDELKLMVVDPKRVELSNYADIPHLLCPIITESKKAKVAFNKLVDEMEKRYSIFQEARVSKISQYNDYAKRSGLATMPYVVVVVDEYADLSDTCRDIHEPVVRIAQKARAAGIHLIISTQRPTTDVVNPRIKTNLPAHVALMMGSYVDSTTILGESGAEKLLGNGDMLVECAIISRTSKPRLQGCFVDISEINRVADYIKKQWPVEYDPNFLDLEEKVEDFRAMSGADIANNTSSREMAEEELYSQLIQDTTEREYTSISFIQRTYGVGFPKAGRLFARLQKDGIVSTDSDSAKGCKVLVHDANFNAPSVNPGSTELIVEEDK
jgi:DNA segregation ATPase FtsK/SpoIIIE-like protein